jgi:hypothetical protein
MNFLAILSRNPRSCKIFDIFFLLDGQAITQWQEG